MHAFRILASVAVVLLTLPSLPIAMGGLGDDEQKKPQPPRPGQGFPEPAQMLERLDKNKDGFLDKDELPERMQQLLEQADENKDGKWSKEELQKAREQFMARRPGAPGSPPPAPNTQNNPEPLFRLIDANGDGKLTKEEFQAGAERLRRLDRNGDGAIDREELAGAMRDQPMRPGAPGNPPMDPARIVGAIFERMDENKDGKISKDEAKGQMAEGFDRLDANKDGFLDKDEVQRIAGRMRPPGDAPRPPNAGERPGRPAAGFDDLDKNADGRITKEEAKGTPLADKFDELDKNKDGRLDPKEFEANAPKK